MRFGHIAAAVAAVLAVLFAFGSWDNGNSNAWSLPLTPLLDAAALSG